MRLKYWSPAFWLAIVYLAGAPAPARGQTATSATVTGIVRDTMNLPMPGVTIEIRNHATNQLSQVVTDAAGRFRILYLPVGDYHLSAQVSGFTTTNVNLSLAVGDQIDVPIVLNPPGSCSLTPSFMRAGRAAHGTGVGDTPHESTACRSTAGTTSIRRSRPTSRALTFAPRIDSLKRRRFRTGVPSPANATQQQLRRRRPVGERRCGRSGRDVSEPEVVREFEVVTSGGGAEFGRASSGTISVVTQSGTNQMRGRAYEFFRNTLR